MKVTQQYLKQLINEEMQKMVDEGELDEGLMDLLSGKKSDKEIVSKIDAKFSDLMKTIQQTVNYLNKYAPQNKTFKDSLTSLYKNLSSVYKSGVLQSQPSAPQKAPLGEE